MQAERESWAILWLVGLTGACIFAIGTYHVVRRRHDSGLQQPQLQLYSNRESGAWSSVSRCCKRALLRSEQVSFIIASIPGPKEKGLTAHKQGDPIDAVTWSQTWYL